MCLYIIGKHWGSFLSHCMHCWKHCCWLVQWCSVSSCSITVHMVGVGILVTTHWQLNTSQYTAVRRSFNMPSTVSTCRTWKTHFCFIFEIFVFQSVHGNIFGFIFDFILWPFFCQTSKMIQKWSQKWLPWTTLLSNMYVFTKWANIGVEKYLK